MPPRLSVTLLTVWPHPHKPRLKLLRVWTARLKKSIPRKRRSAIFPSTVDQFRGQTTDVLVAHKVSGTHEHGFSAIDELAVSLGSKLVVYGHYHEAITTCLKGHAAAVRGMGMAEVWYPGEIAIN